MKISLHNIWQGIKTTAIRFPFVVTISIIGTAIALWLVHNETTDIFSQSFFTLILGFPLLTSATLFAEQQMNKRNKVLAFVVPIFFLAIYGLFISENLFLEINQAKDYMQYIAWVISATVLMTFAPFIKKQATSILNFWQYNQKGLYALLATIVYSGAIYAGLSVALLAVNELFDLNIDNVRWLELFIIIIGLFTTTFFLSRFPNKEDIQIAAEGSEIVYPKELRIFSYYVLTPLVAIYFLILYSYTGKILISWEWPKGIISSMILGFSILGIFTYSILYPLLSKEGHLAKVSKIFFGIMIPQIIVLFWAVWIRISDYGFTEQRYLLVIFGAWLLGMSAYFIFSQFRNIKFIAVSLFVVIVGVSFGPWGMFQISERSQINRLEVFLIQNGILVDGKIVPLTADEESQDSVFEDDKQEISSITFYLHDNHGLDGIQKWFDKDIHEILYPAGNTPKDKYSDSIGCIGYGCSNSDTLLKSLFGLDYSRYGNYRYLDDDPDHLNFTSNIDKYNRGFNVKGYDHLLQSKYSSLLVESRSLQETYRFNINEDVAKQTYALIVQKEGRTIKNISLAPFIEELTLLSGDKNTQVLTEDEMTFTYSDSDIDLKILFSTITIDTENNIFWSDETILVRFKNI